jgi:hypothetical protein
MRGVITETGDLFSFSADGGSIWAHKKTERKTSDLVVRRRPCSTSAAAYLCK